MVNERDELGSDLVPDYLTSVRDGGFYGWPYSYYGQHVDERVQAANGPTWWPRRSRPTTRSGRTPRRSAWPSPSGDACPPPFASGIFIGQHGSWNRQPHSGYKVIFVPFADGRPPGAPIDVLTGFLERRRQGARPAGRRGDRPDAAPCWWPTTSAT